METSNEMTDPECIEFIGEREFLKQTRHENYNEAEQGSNHRRGSDSEGLTVYRREDPETRAELQAARSELDFPPF